MNGKAGQYCSCTAKKQVSKFRLRKRVSWAGTTGQPPAPPHFFVQFSLPGDVWQISLLSTESALRNPHNSRQRCAPLTGKDGSRMPGPGYPTGRHGTRLYIHKHGRVSLLQSTLALNTEKVAFFVSSDLYHSRSDCAASPSANSSLHDSDLSLRLISQIPFEAHAA